MNMTTLVLLGLAFLLFRLIARVENLEGQMTAIRQMLESAHSGILKEEEGDAK